MAITSGSVPASHVVDSPIAWRMSGIAFVAGFIVFGVVYSFGVFLEPLMADLGTSRSATSALYAISSSAFYFLGPLTGSIGDRVGPRRVTAVGAVVMGVGLAATALVADLWTAYLTYGLGVGIGAACAYIPTFAILGAWFDRFRTRALSIAAAGTGCGMLVLPPLAAVLIERMGWRGAFVAMAALSAGLLGGCAAFVLPPPSRPAPEASGLGSTLRSREFSCMYVSWVLATMALFVPLVFLPAFATRHGADPVAASWLISIVGGASIVGRLGIGYVTTPSSTMRLYKTAVLAMALSYVMWLMSPAFAWLSCFAAVLGLAYGVRIALVAPVLIELFGVSRLGALLGSFFTATGIAGLLGPVLASLAVDVTASQQGAIVAAVVMGGLGFLFILPLKAR